jgi:hypothetical protein
MDESPNPGENEEPGRGWAEYHRPDVKKRLPEASRRTAGDALIRQTEKKTCPLVLITVRVRLL